MVETLLHWLEANEGVGAYVVLALASALEYVVPPIPGDTIALFGVFLAATAGYHVGLVYLTLTAGSIGGSLLAYAFGVFLGRREDRWPGFLRGPRTLAAIHRVLDRFEERGPAYLALNRFVPALRAVFFIAAGIRGMALWKVALYGGLSAAAWNALILAIGWSVGNEWERMRALADGYEIAVVIALVAVSLAVLARYLWKRHAER